MTANGAHGKKASHFYTESIYFDMWVDSLLDQQSTKVARQKRESEKLTLPRATLVRTPLFLPVWAP